MKIDERKKVQSEIDLLKEKMSDAEKDGREEDYYFMSLSLQSLNMKLNGDCE